MQYGDTVKMQIQHRTKALLDIKVKVMVLTELSL